MILQFNYYKMRSQHLSLIRAVPQNIIIKKLGMGCSQICITSEDYAKRIKRELMKRNNMRIEDDQQTHIELCIIWFYNGRGWGSEEEFNQFFPSFLYNEEQRNSVKKLIQQAAEEYYHRLTGLPVPSDNQYDPEVSAVDSERKPPQLP
eukprot:TRINITY_DN6306_c0_g2_i1.p8 TRINITY_DN6306_c0_g2~~TRINITY_DN6306_c0_g2_i1.p8  ORF type:complete len:148 (+),score=1.03 TRINITY_DN6306_c0_g2_i1:1442-1885(+)